MYFLCPICKKECWYQCKTDPSAFLNEETGEITIKVTFKLKDAKFYCNCLKSKTYQIKNVSDEK